MTQRGAAPGPDTAHPTIPLGYTTPTLVMPSYVAPPPAAGPQTWVPPGPQSWAHPGQQPYPVPVPQRSPWVGLLLALLFGVLSLPYGSWPVALVVWAFLAWTLPWSIVTAALLWPVTWVATPLLVHHWNRRRMRDAMAS